MSELDGGTRLADAAQAVDGGGTGTGDDGCHTPMPAMVRLRERGSDRLQELLTPFEERSEALEEEIVHLEIGFETEVEEDLTDEVVMAAELLVVLTGVEETLPMRLLKLRALLTLADGHATVEESFRFGEIDQGPLLEASGEVVLPLGVGAGWQRNGISVAEVSEEGSFVFRGGLRSGRFTDEMDDEIAVADIVGETVEEGVSALLEVLLDFDFAGSPPERTQLVGELESVGSELGADAGEEDPHAVSRCGILCACCLLLPQVRSGEWH